MKGFKENIMDVLCKHCGKPLKKAQNKHDANGNKFKSCPKCSQDNGDIHIYYKYPDYFGTSEKRVTKQHPDGPQSYCQNCREEIFGPHVGAFKCSDFKK